MFDARDARTRSVELAERSGAVLLVDETYRDLTHDDAAADGRVALAARDQRLVDVEGVRPPGPAGRLGGVPRPELAETLLAAKEQMVICGATLDEAIAGRVLADRDRILPPILDDVRARLAIVRDWMAAQDTFEWIEPRAASSASCGSGRRRRSTPRASTTCCSPSTAPTSGPATGSRSTIATSASASAGRPHAELRAGLTALTDAAAATVTA